MLCSPSSVRARVWAPLVLSCVAFAPARVRAADAPDPVKPRVTLTPRIGLGFPGQATAHQISRTKLGVGFVMHHDAMIALGDWFELGPYLHYSVRGIKERGTAPTDGLRNHLVSLGAALKVPIPTSARSRLRIGLMLGYNYTKQGFANDTFEGDIVASGFNVAPSVEWSHDIARRVAFNLQLAMITQVVGRANLGAIGGVVEGGEKQKMGFPPLAFLAVGFDFGLGSR